MLPPRQQQQTPPVQQQTPHPQTLPPRMLRMLPPPHSMSLFGSRTSMGQVQCLAALLMESVWLKATDMICLSCFATT